VLLGGDDDEVGKSATIEPELATTPEPAEVAPPKPAPEPELEPAPEPEPVDASSEPGEAAEAGETGDGEEGLEQQVAERVTVPVEFVANEFFFVYVKVGSRVLTLEPRQRVELAEGRHTVFLRQSPDEKWVRAGRITIEPGSEYRVEMRKPASLQLVKK
jgi:eukaryotic-like serine/threonine-protein kinase